MGIKRGFSAAELSKGKDKNVSTRNTMGNSAMGHVSEVHDLSTLNVCFLSDPFPKYQLVIHVSPRKSYMAFFS